MPYPLIASSGPVRPALGAGAMGMREAGFLFAAADSLADHGRRGLERDRIRCVVPRGTEVGGAWPGAARPTTSRKTSHRPSSASVPILSSSCHNDADGLSAGVILKKALQRAGHSPEVRIIGKGEKRVSDAFRREIADRALGGLVIADLGVSAKLPRDDVSGCPPRPPCADRLPHERGHDQRHRRRTRSRPPAFLPIVAPRRWGGGRSSLVGGHRADRRPRGRRRVCRNGGCAFALRHHRAPQGRLAGQNAPRRTQAAMHRPRSPSWRRRMAPKAVLSASMPRPPRCSTKSEVATALDAARMVAPSVSGDVAIVRFASGCQIHPLVAQAWRGTPQGPDRDRGQHGYRGAGCTLRRARRPTAISWPFWPTIVPRGPTSNTATDTGPPPAARCAQGTGTHSWRVSVSAPR